MYKLVVRFINYKYFEYIVLSFIILSGLLLRLYKIQNPIADWHSFRQVDTASVSRYFYLGETDFLHPKYHDVSRVQSGLDNPEGYRFVEFPIYNYLNALLAKYIAVFNLEVWGRLTSIISALFSGVLLFFLGKKFISKWGGILASFFYLFIPYNIYFTRVILPEPLAVLFGLSALTLFVKFIDFERFLHLALSAIFLAAALLVKPYLIFYGVPMVFLALNKYSFKKVVFDWRFIVFGLISILPFVFWRLWISNFPEGVPFWAWVFNGDGIRFRPAFWYWIFGERLTKLLLGFMGLIPFAIGVMAVEKSKNFLHHFLLGMFLYVSVIATASVKHDYYQTLVVPAVSLILAWGVVKLWIMREFNIKIRRGVVIFSILMMLIAGAIQVREFYKINHPEIIEAGIELDKIAPKDALIIASYNGDTAFLYQTKRRGWPVVELPINELIAKGATYYASVNLDDAQTIEFMNKFEVVKKTQNYVILKLN